MQQSEDNHIPSLKTRTAKGLLWSGASNVLQQVLGLLFGIVLARILSVEDYGMIGMVAIFYVLASAFQESGFVSGIANIKEISHKDYNAVFWCSVSTGSILYIALFLLSPLIAKFYGIPELTLLARVSFLSFWFASFGIVHQAYLFRNLMIRERSITMLIATLVSGGVGIFMAIYGFGYWGLAVQVISYSLVTSISATLFSKFRPSLHFDLQPVLKILNYSVKVLIANIFIHLNNHIFALILGRFYSANHVGSLTQANKWNLMSQSVVSGMSTSITQPVMRAVVDNEERQKRVFRKIVQFTAFVSFPLMFGLALLAEDFIVIAITEKWLDSAYFLKVLSLGGAFAVISTVFSNTVLSRGRSSIYMWGIISFGVLQIILLLLLYPYGAVHMVVSSAILQFVWLFVWFVQVKKYLQYTFYHLLGDVFSYAVLAAFSMIATYLLVFSIEHLYARFVLSVLIAAVFYASLNFLFKPAVIKEIFTFFFQKIHK